MADTATADEKETKANSEAEKRIASLTKKIAEQEKLLNMKSRIDEVADTANEALRNSRGAEKEPEDEGGWLKFLGPKVGPLIEKALLPYKQAIVNLADYSDKLETMLEHPKYRTDPELQEEVESIRRQRQKQTGMAEPRKNVITYLKGEKPELFKEEENTMQNRREENSAIHTESNAGVGGPRAEKPGGHGLTTDSTVEEIEKYLMENPEDAILK